MNPEKVLPPGVNGKITGYLMVKVDEIFWARNSPGEVFVELQWWGEKDSTIFRPEDITLNEPKRNSDSSVTYNIRTSPGLFESYLRNCGRITFTVLRGLNKNVVLGTAVVKDVEQIISQKNYHSYFSIFSPKGNRIGDLHIGFELTFKHVENHFTLKHRERRPDLKSQNAAPSKSSKSASSEEDKLLSNILQKGHELRKAMVMSVLADCPVDNLESVVNCHSDYPYSKQQFKKDEAKLVDFLLGKHMSSEEEMKAIETLRCVSPSENLIEIAKVDEAGSKSKCCLHGRECAMKNVKFKKKDQKQAPAVTQSSPETDSTAQSPSNTAGTDEEPQVVRVEAPVKRTTPMKFNCYRLIISKLKLTLDGSRKIFYIPGKKETFKQNIKGGRNHNPPGTSFFLEATLPSSKAGGKWSRTVKFFTKNFRGPSIDFSQGSTHRLSGSVTWSRVRSLLVGTVFIIYWRHLNQRVPCPLGSTKLEELSPENGANSVSLCLPVYSNTRMLTGFLNVTISLGTLENFGEEMMFHIEKEDEINHDKDEEDIDDFPAQVDINDDVEPETRFEKCDVEPKTRFEKCDVDDSPTVSDSDDVIPAPSLDEELMKTIDLLNSKPVTFLKKDHVIEKQEACVQTTLPLTETECPVCHCKKPAESGLTEPKMKNDHNKEHFSPYKEDVAPNKEHFPYNKEQLAHNKEHFPPHKEHLTHNKEHFLPNKQHFEHNYKTEVPSKDGGNNGRTTHHRCKERKLPCHKDNFDEDYFHPNLAYPSAYRTAHLPIEFQPETIHEFTVKIEKVVGVPMFTGDKDMDCYVDYSFPKVDCNGIMVFDRITNGTGVRMALRETDFGTVNRHRLRLNCKLTTALLSLPSHEITFSIWGRFYRPSPRDYRLGKATVPLMRLSTLELVFCQQIKREPIFERLIVPIDVVESSMTSGYKGPFGDLHLVLGYSCASGRSYRQWKEKTQGNNDFHYETMTRNIRSDQIDYIDPANNCNVLNNNRFMNENERNGRSCREESEHSEIRNDHLNAPTLIQSNFKQGGSKNLKESDSNRIGQLQDGYSEYVKPKASANVHYTINREILPTKDLCTDNKYHVTHKHHECPSDSTLGNVVKEVIGEIRERQVDHGRNPADPFESFDLKVDLPVQEESVDFDARSQYSFLCTPPPIPPLVPSQRSHLALESDSSCSLKDKIQIRKPANPFSSLSNASFSMNSDCSMFIAKNGKKDNEQLCPERSAPALGKDLPHSSRQIRQCSVESDKIIPGASQKSNTANSYSIKEAVVSSDATLDSVESLKSYKDEPQGRISKDIGVETEFITQNKNTQTSCTSYKDEDHFKACVQICRALSLPSVEVRQSNGKIVMVKPTSCAYFCARINGTPQIFKTDLVEKKSNPIWNASWDVELPVEFLKKCDRELEIFVELSGGDEEPARESDCSSRWPIVLRTGVDLTPITAGLEHASGWFSLSDRALLSRAQLKVVVTPLEDTTRFRDDWLKEYTKTKGKKLDVNIPHSSAIATSLQEKLKELEKLTQRMKNKMDDKPNWDMSPPFELLSEVEAINFSQEQIVPQPSKRRPGSVKKVETSTSPIIITSSESDSNSPINHPSKGEDKSTVKTYTVARESDSSQHDSLETPSETIDRILSRVRTKR